HISNVKVVCPKCGRPTRVGIRILEDNSKVRYCKHQDCGEII
ncbi:MAG TPA: 50S ribosomal protein L24, partial [Calditrichae bacterium]|nr:50S ribosomal protein L24 [Calditrichia bacterium]